jgi:hypothetical protein
MQTGLSACVADISTGSVPESGRANCDTKEKSRTYATFFNV